MTDERLPEIVRQAVKRDFPAFARTSFELEKAQTGEELFEFETSSDESDQDVTYDKNGNRVTPNACED